MTTQWDLQRGYEPLSFEALSIRASSRPDSEELRKRQQRAAAWVGVVGGLMAAGLIGLLVGVPEGVGAAVVLGALGWLRGRFNGAFQRGADLVAAKATK